MGKILGTTLVSLMSTGFLIAAGPAAYGMAGSCSAHTPAEHGCNGYGGMMNHPEFNDHCNHESGGLAYPGAQNCCNDPGWVAANPPAPSSLASGGNSNKTSTRAVSTKPRSINVSTD